jgi:phosphate:Na+ symporter
VPDRPAEEGTVVRARYLDPELLPTPSLALDRVRLEILHMGERVTEMMRAVLPAVLDGDEEELRRIAAMDDALDTLHGETVTYLGRISQGALTDEQTQELLRLMEATGSLENIGDIIETNLVALGLTRIREGVTVSAATREVIEGFHRAVSRALDASIHAGTQKNEEAARRVVDMKQEINRLADDAARHQAQRLVAEEPGRLEAYTFETDVLQNLKRIYYFTKRMTRLTVPAILAKGT